MGKLTFVVDAKEPAGGASKELPIDVEIARKDHDRQRGLMFRTQMPCWHPFGRIKR
jgi:uncharacterized membrane protein (UPF0127 family)